MNVLVVIGTRPEAIKMAPVIQELRGRPETFTVKVCVTGQHRDLLDQVIRIFDIRVDHDLNIMTPGQSIHEVTSRVLTGMQSVLSAERPDVLLVHGDTTTSFSAALAGYYAKIPVGHVEAGLRTYDHYQPFPEEINRRLADALCTYHYAPTRSAKENLVSERIAARHILVTGNTVIDALLQVSARSYTFAEPWMNALGESRRMILVTAHRRESFGPPFRSMCRAIAGLVERNPDVEVVYPVHPNPNVREVTGEYLAGRDRIHLVDPQEYLPFVHLLKKAYLVLTDSGGIQEEAPSLGKPVLVMREVTERPEAIAAGTAELVGTDEKRILERVQRLLDDRGAYQAMANRVNPYGDGLAGHRIAEHLASLG